MQTRAIKVLMPVEGEGQIYQCGAIDYEGEIWIVPEWLPAPDEGFARPERIVLLRQFHATINVPVPKALFVGPIPPEIKARYVVVERPNIWARTGGVRH
jgi:hypothetical protein